MVPQRLNNKSITLKDIGRAVGVSHATVSRVLNNVPGSFASPQTRARIMAVAREMGYQPSLAARTLRRSRTHIIGVTAGYVPGSIEKIDMLDRLARKSGYQMMISYTHGEAETEAEVLRNMVGWNVEGILMLGPSQDGDGTAVGEVMNRGIAVVSIGRVPNQPTCVVTADRRAAALVAGSHLVQIGRKRIALAYWGDTNSARLIGLREALTQNGRNPDDICIISANDAKAAYRSVREDLKHGLTFDALFAGNFPIGVGAMCAIVDAGLRIPHDIAVIAQGETEASSWTPIPMTTVSLAEPEVLRAGFEMLVAQIENPDDRAVRRLLFEPQLIVRQSTVDDENIERSRLRQPL